MHRLLLRFAVDHPKLVLGVAAFLTILAFLAAPNIRLRLDGRSLIPAGEKSLRASDEASATFKLKDVVVLSLVARNRGVINREGLERVGKMSAELQRTVGIIEHSVTSIATLPLLAAREGVIDPEPPLAGLAIDSARVATVRREIASLGLDNGILLSKGGTSAAIYAFVRSDADRDQLLERVEEIAESYRGGDFEVYIGGTALAQAELGRSVASDLFKLVPCLLILLMILMSMVFRNVSVSIISLAEIGLSLAWTVGLMGILGQSIFITTLALPVVLIAIGVTDDIYAINRYIGQRRKFPDQDNRDVIVEAFHSLGKPIILTALTSMSGLASLAFASLEPLRVFGLFGAFSIGLSTIFTFTIVPAILAIRPPALREGSVRANRRLAKFAISLLGLVEKVGRRRMVAVVLVLSIGAVAVAVHLRIDDSWVKNLAPGSQVAMGDRAINQYMAGSTTMDFSIGSKTPDGFLDPATFRHLAAMEEALGRVPRVGAVQSTFTDVLRIMATLRGVAYPEFRRGILNNSIPLTRDDIESALLVDETLDRPHMGVYMADGRRNARMTVFVHEADYEHLRPVLEMAARESANGSLSATPFGDGWISYITVKLLVEGQIISILFAALADLLFVALMLRSIRTACVAVLPVLLGVLFTFAALTLFDSPLGIASSMFASIALGIGVDYSIHLAVESREACRHSPNFHVALRRAFAETAPSIIISGSTITTGFAVLLLSSVVPNRMFGLLVCVSLSICAVMTLIVVPGLAEMFGLWSTVKRADRHATVVSARPRGIRAIGRAIFGHTGENA
ncbi:MAG: MMPL family transporter [Candidatus Kapaibacterium sp.]